MPIRIHAENQIERLIGILSANETVPNISGIILAVSIGFASEKKKLLQRFGALIQTSNLKK